MNKIFRKFALAAVLVSVSIGLGPLEPARGAKPSASLVPSTGLVNDDPSNKVRSDGRGLYIHGVDCVAVQVGAMGFYQIRTVHNSDMCNGELSWWSPNPSGLPVHRYLTLDFGASTPGDLDGNGTAATVEKAPARFISPDAFARGATTASVQILILKVNVDGTTTQDTAWQFTYQSRADVVVNSDGSRVISLLPGHAAADLCEVVQTVGRGGKVSTTCQFVGTFDMPFQVTAK